MQIKKISTFVILTFALSLIGYSLAIKGKVLGINYFIAVFILMWCPGISALITQYIFYKNFEGLGFRPGNWRWLALGYFLPIAYSTFGYVFIWIAGLGALAVKHPINIFGIVILGTIWNIAYAAGEEIGWRGFFVPELYKIAGFTKTALIVGVIWSLWHFPLIISGVYLSVMPLGPQLLLLIVTVTAMTFPLAWLRLRSGSVWPAILLHASHNLYIQRLFDPITQETSSLSKFMLGESGIVLSVIFVALALVFFGLRKQLPSVNS